VKDSVLQSTLRELKGLSTSRNLWLTFAAVVLLFAFTGPFGTMERLPFLPRLAYWLVLHAAAWTAALVFAVLGNILLTPFLKSMFWRMMIGAVLAAIPIGVVTRLVEYFWFGGVPTIGDLVAEMALAVPLCVIFCVISYLAMSSSPELPGKPTPQAQPIPPAPLAKAMETAPLLARLKPENRGALQHLSVEDHYTLVKTSRGRELILLRLSDAIRETGATPGLQVHRSHWVADNFVKSLKRDDGKLSLILTDGTEIPVSRTYAADVRNRFGDR
jgi:DNA-binding LytR/AlgR family response regulator